MTATLSFAFAAGMLSTVNPYGFALLPASLAHLLGATPQPVGTAGRALAARMAVGLRGGITVAAGFAAVYTLAGLLVAAGLRTVIEVVPAVAVGLGVVLILLGVALLTGRSPPLPQRLRSAGPTTRAPGSLLAFGIAYAVASLSCTLAVLLAVVGQALATANLAALFAVFAAYAAGAASLITALAVTTVLASGALTSPPRGPGTSAGWRRPRSPACG